MFILPILKLGLFCTKRAICRELSTSVGGGQSGKDGRVGQKTGDRIQKTECGLAMNSRRAGICVAFGLCFDVDFDIDHLLSC